MVADTPKINQKFKDRLFRMVFQSKKDLLAKHKAEVIDVVLNEYNEQEHMELERIE